MKEKKTKQAQEYLQRIKKLDILIENKMQERERWRSVAFNTSSAWGGERVQSAGNPQKMASAIDNYLDIESEISRDLAQKIAARKEIIDTIETLPPREYDVLHKIYVQYLTLQDFAALNDKTYRWASGVHGQALLSVQKILNEREEKQ